MCVTLPAKIHIYLSRCSFCEYFVNILTTLRSLIDRQPVDLVRYLKCVVLHSVSFALLIRVEIVHIYLSRCNYYDTVTTFNFLMVKLLERV